MKPKSAYVAGIVSGMMGVFTIGFFVLLGLWVNGDTGKVAGSTTKNSNTNAVAVAPSPTPSAAAPTLENAAADVTVEPVTDADWIKGDPNAPVTIIEFSDTECPFCKRVHPTLQQLVDEYEGQVNWVYRHFPLASLHSKAPREAEALECAGELGGNDGFWAYTDKLYEITPSNDGLLDTQLPQIAEEVGLDPDAFTECLDSGRYTDKVNQQLQQASAAGGQGTPHSIIVSGDTTIPVSGAVPIEQFRQAIDLVL